ncbi:MAG TPA: tetratricopeptide repeat protein [Candidatus Limnocylindrales bacterium]|nr:tetratricopeptide repeat protein [Candidatus Limnocylindrales bacterium]
MKCLAVFAVLFAALSLSPRARAQENPDDQYLIIYALIQQADAFENSGEPRRALDDYAGAQNDLQSFQRVFPDWNPRIVNFRLNYLAAKIAEVTAKLPSTNTPPPTAAVPAAPGVPPMATNAAAAATAALQSQLNALQEQVRRLQGDNETLQSKLKEALAVQPAAVSPDQLAQVQQQLRLLMKENDLLKVSLARGNGSAAAGVDARTFELLKQALAESNQKLASQTERADKLSQENQTLQTRLQSLLASADAAEALRQENELLKKQVASLQSAPAAVTGTGNAAAELARAQTRIAALQSASEVNLLEKLALENRVNQLQGRAPKPPPAVTGPSQAENEARIRELEQERNELLARLGDANKKLYGPKGQDAAAQIDALAQQVDTLRARIAVDEAQAVPYTPEELALFKQSTPSLTANPNAEKKSVHELPGGAASLVAEAQNYFSAREYGKAAADYQQILKQDENNGLALANLAAIELEENKLDDADKHIQGALAQSPNDAYNLTVQGRIQFAEAKYDEALDALSRAAKLDPQNPDIENYLGVTLAQKGLRTQAETALRRAVQLDPNYGAAHNNLAVIYLTQQPPMVELARWHYEKALAAGQPHNPALEKMLAEKGAPVSQ